MITQTMAQNIFGRRPTAKQIVDLNDCLINFEINTAARVRHFLSQCAHESSGLKYVKEIASGRAYNGRRDLGNVYAGDGPRFKGAGVIQLTGRSNYQAFSRYMNDPDIMAGVEYVSQKYPFMSAGFWWHNNGMNARCDRGASVKEITRKVNGGYNGLTDREKYFRRCVAVIPSNWTLFVPPPSSSQSDGQIPEFDPSIPEPATPAPNPVETTPTIPVNEHIAAADTPQASGGGDVEGVLGGYLDQAGGAGGVIDKAGKISRSSFWTTITSKLGAWGVLAVGLFEDNMTVIIVGAVIVIAVLLWFHFSKQRATVRSIAAK